MATLQQSINAYNDMIMSFVLNGKTSLELDELPIKTTAKILCCILQLNILKLENGAALDKKLGDETSLTNKLVTIDQLKVDLQAISKLDVKKIERFSAIYSNKLNQDIKKCIQELCYEQANERRMWESEQDISQAQQRYIEQSIV